MSGVQPEAVQVTLRLAAALESLGVPYLVGGSLASSFHGIPRSTADADLVVDLRREHVPSLVAALAPEFYIDDELVLEAVHRRASFNLIHLATLFKVDVFILKLDRLSQLEMARRQRINLGQSALDLASPEDTVLQKLLWFRQGGGSDRQWGDILGVLKVQRRHLDLDYLRKWAEDEGLTELLDKALQDAASPT